MDKITRPVSNKPSNSSQPSTLVPEVRVLLEDLLAKKPNARVLDFWLWFGSIW